MYKKNLHRHFSPEREVGVVTTEWIYGVPEGKLHFYTIQLVWNVNTSGEGIPVRATPWIQHCVLRTNVRERTFPSTQLLTSYNYVKCIFIKFRFFNVILISVTEIAWKGDEIIIAVLVLLFISSMQLLKITKRIEVQKNIKNKTAQPWLIPFRMKEGGGGVKAAFISWT